MPERAPVATPPKPDGERRQPEHGSHPRNDADQLRSRAESAEKQREDYLALLQRTQADFENYQKRVQREMAEERRYAHAGLAKELLPALDNLRRALAAAEAADDRATLTQGVRQVQSQLSDIFNRVGIATLDPLGQEFDPHFHEAVAEMPRIDVSPGTVVQVLEPGYRLYDRLLRPARVVVASK
jgi:molecular chaperone GrpE